MKDWEPREGEGLRLEPGDELGQVKPTHTYKLREGRRREGKGEREKEGGKVGRGREEEGWREEGWKEGGRGMVDKRKKDNDQKLTLGISSVFQYINKTNLFEALSGTDVQGMQRAKLRVTHKLGNLKRRKNLQFCNSCSDTAILTYLHHLLHELHQSFNTDAPSTL